MPNSLFNLKKGISTPIILLIVVLVLVVLGGIFTWQYLKNQKETQLNEEVKKCDEIKNQEEKNRCYINIAEAKQDLSICDKIQNKEIRDECFRMF